MVSLLSHLLKACRVHGYGAFVRAYEETARALGVPSGAAPSESTYKRWINGTTGLPHPHHRQILETMFPQHTVPQLVGRTNEPEVHAPGQVFRDLTMRAEADSGHSRSASDETGAGARPVLGPADWAAIVNLGASPDHEEYTTSDGRRLFDAGHAYAGIAARIRDAARSTSQHAMNAGAFSVSPSSVDQLAEDTASVACAFDTTAPGASVLEMTRIQEDVKFLLERTRQPGQQQQLYLLAAQIAALMSSACADLSMWGPAQTFARSSFTYGEMIGHHGVLAYVRGMQAMISYWNDRPVEAVRYAAQATDLAPVGIARVRAHSIAARAWAHHGVEAGVVGALASAEDARADSGSDELHDVIGGEFGFSAPRQALCASTAWVQLGRPAKATTAASEALRLIVAQGSQGSGLSVLEAESRVDLATCQILAGNPAAAEATMMAALDVLSPMWEVSVDDRRMGLYGRLDKLRVLLNDPTWHRVAEARRLIDMVNTFAVSRPALPQIGSTALPPS